MKFFKRLCVLALLAVAGVFLARFVQRVRMTMRLAKTLPLFLKNTIGEEPRASLSLTLNRLDIRLGFCAEMQERAAEIESAVVEYIDDFYPALSGVKIVCRVETREALEGTGCCCGTR
jgi:hypothetical protein